MKILISAILAVGVDAFSLTHKTLVSPSVVQQRNRYQSLHHPRTSRTGSTIIAVATEDEIEAAASKSAFLEPKEGILSDPIPYADLTIGVLKETYPGEQRVSQTPDSVRSLVKAGLTVVVQEGGELLLAFLL